MVRAVLDSVAFRAKQMYECILEEVNYDLSHIKQVKNVSPSSPHPLNFDFKNT